MKLWQVQVMAKKPGKPNQQAPWLDFLVLAPTKDLAEQQVDRLLESHGWDYHPHTCMAYEPDAVVLRGPDSMGPYPKIS